MLASDGEVGTPFAPVVSSVSTEAGGFHIFGIDFPGEGLRGLSTFGDSIWSGVFYACEAEWIYWGTLHRNPWVSR
jgi:hypothetical protein